MTGINSIDIGFQRTRSRWQLVTNDSTVAPTVFEQEITADLHVNTQFLAPRLFMDNGPSAVVVACDRSGPGLQSIQSRT